MRSEEDIRKSRFRGLVFKLLKQCNYKHLALVRSYSIKHSIK